jgi:hypothetical protein
MTTRELSVGDRVETVRPDVESDDWTQEAMASRRWGVTGSIVREHNSHGLCYRVRHDDGSHGVYEARELRVLRVSEEP